jgi:uncharacterized protein (DUF1015 family)
MIEVKPFHGLLYDTKVTGPLADVTAPPYDVISPALQESLYQKNPHNIVRLILGKVFSTDSEIDNRYTRSANTFSQWLMDKVLVRDPQPGFYLYRQEYEFEGEKFCRTGFFARVKTEAFSEGNILPHEFTLSKAKTDRTHLLNACHANFSPIFGLYSDPKGNIDALLKDEDNIEPLSVINDGSVVHRIWRLNNPAICQKISDQIRDKKIYIADGHHRYETALAFSEANQGKVEDCAHVMMFLTNMDSDSMSIFPIHRVVKSPEPFDRESFLKKAGEYFDISPWSGTLNGTAVKSKLKELGDSQITFCAYMGKDHTFILKVKGQKNIVPLLDHNEPEDMQVLDVAQLHALLFRHILKIDTREKSEQQHVSYKVNSEEAMEMVNSREYDIAFFMNPTLIEHVRRLAEKGVRLPQKATFFYPKLLSGLVINKFGL